MTAEVSFTSKSIEIWLCVEKNLGGGFLQHCPSFSSLWRWLPWWLLWPMGDLGFLNAAIGARLATKGSAYPNVPAAVTAIIIIIIIIISSSSSSSSSKEMCLVCHRPGPWSILWQKKFDVSWILLLLLNVNVISQCIICNVLIDCKGELHQVGGNGRCRDLPHFVILSIAEEKDDDGDSSVEIIYQDIIFVLFLYLLQ